MMKEGAPSVPPQESFGKLEDEFLNSEPGTYQKSLELSDAARGDFSKDEKEFFGDTTEQATEVKAEPILAQAEEEASPFEKMAAELNESIAQKEAEDTTALAEAKATLANVTETSNVVPLYPDNKKTADGFDEFDQQFFAEGEKKYGVNKDDGPNPDGGEAAAAA